MATFPRGGVATLARLGDGRIMAANQHFPEHDQAGFDKVAVRFSKDEGNSWSEAQVIQLAGLPDGMRFPFDPTLVPLPDGRVRLYFTSVRQPKRGTRPDGESQPAIYSAVSTSGITFTVEPGMRFGVTGRMVIDCAVALHAGVFHLYSPDNGRLPLHGREPDEEDSRRPAEDRPRAGFGYHAVSKDGLKFERVTDVHMEDQRQWLGNAWSDGGRIYFIGTGGHSAPGGREGGIWMASSLDGQNWTLSDPLPSMATADPGAVRLRNGDWLIAGTGRPRAGTPSAARRPGRPNPPPP